MNLNPDNHCSSSGGEWKEWTSPSLENWVDAPPSGKYRGAI